MVTPVKGIQIGAIVFLITQTLFAAAQSSAPPLPVVPQGSCEQECTAFLADALNVTQCISTKDPEECACNLLKNDISQVPSIHNHKVILVCELPQSVRRYPNLCSS